MDERSVEEILNDNPFDTDSPSKYELYLETALKLAFHNIAGLTMAVEHLNARIKEHDRLHNASNVAALKMPDISKDEKPN